MLTTRIGILVQRRVFLRLFSTCERSENIINEYQKQNRWESVKEFSDFLIKSIIHNSDGLVILSKPYGVPLAPAKLETNAAIPTQYSLTDSLPYLARNLGYESLTVIKAPQRYASGITVLSPCEKIADKVKKSLLKGNSRGQFCSYYVALVLGCPQPKSAVAKVGLTLEKNPVVSNDKKPVVVTEWSNISVKRGLVKVFKVQHSTLCSESLASLVEISPSTTKWHFMRVYLAHLQSPILGDHLYGNRVHYLMNTYLSINHFSDSAKGTQKIHPDVQKILSIQPGQESLIPTHLHLWKLVIPQYTTKKYDFVIELAPPEWFQRTCHYLNIVDSTDDMYSRVRIVNNR